MTKRIALCWAGLLFAGPLMAATITTQLIDGRKVELVAVKNPAALATVVFENGSRATVDKWDKVIDGIASQASVFAYNRPGYGDSTATDTPRDGLTIVEELRRNLQHEGRGRRTSWWATRWVACTCSCSPNAIPTKWPASCWSTRSIRT